MKEKITGNYKRILAIVMSILMIFGICSVRQDVLAATGNLYTDINAASFNIYIDQETTNTTLLGLLGKYVDHTGSCVTPSNISCQDPDDIIADAPFVAPNWTIVLTGKVGNATIRMDASTNQCGVYGTQTANGATMHVVVDYSPACKFIQTYLGGHWNGVPASKTYEGTFTTSAGNEELIYSGMDAWNRLTPTEQAEVNAAVKAANPENDSYEDLLAKAFQEKQDQAKILLMQRHRQRKTRSMHWKI